MMLYEASPDYLNHCRQALAIEQAKSLAETNNWSHVDKSASTYRLGHLV